MDCLCDGNVIIDHLNGAHEATAFILNNSQSLGISAVTRIEVLGFAFPTPKAESAAEELINSMVNIGISEKIIACTITLRKKVRIKIPDAIIASTALCHQCLLVTRNTDDFKDVEGLKCVDPFAKSGLFTELCT